MILNFRKTFIKQKIFFQHIVKWFFKKNIFKNVINSMLKM